MDEPKLIKVLLQNQGRDMETPFAEDLGPVPRRRGARRVRLVNVPFLHAKPTYGDEIVVEPNPEGFPTWDLGGVEAETRIHKDGGRYAVIVDYQIKKGARSDAEAAFQSLSKTAEAHDLVPEGMRGPTASKPGRVYFAVPNKVKPAKVMTLLRAGCSSCELTLVHPV